MSRYNQLHEDMLIWIAQYRPDLKMNSNQNSYSGLAGHFNVDVYGLGVRESYYYRAGNSKSKDETLWTKAEVRKGVTFLTSAADGKKYFRPTRARKDQKFQVWEPKRKLSQASVLKNRYRRALITIPRQIQKLEDAVAEVRIELPIVQEESQRLYNSIQHIQDIFEKKYNISLKPYPYFQSITRFAGKLGGHGFRAMRDELWELRDMYQRHDDLERRQREIGRYVRSADSKIHAAKQKQAKLGHGRDPNKKLSWER